MASRPDAYARTRLLILVVGCGLLVVSTISIEVQALANRVGWIHSVLVAVLVFVSALPSRLLILTGPLALGTLYLASQANELKIAAVALPITFLDVQISLADPTVVLNALGISATAIYAVAALVLLTIGSLIAYMVHGRVPQSHARAGTAAFRSVAVSALTLIIVLLAAQTSLISYARFVNEHLRTLYPSLWLDLWQPPSQVSLSRQLGILEYLAFTYLAGDDTADGGSSLPEYPGEDVRGAVRTFVAPRILRSPTLPNLVIFHAESTFDPNIIFRLTEPVESPLWSPTTSTALVGPLRVNVVGGGSWVTEFEVLTGVDSRIFGYQGYYTHNYIAPLVQRSLAHYLVAKGYRSAAYYSVSGSFYNAERAFRHYGFQEFIGGPALGLEEDWTELVDRKIITKVIEHGAFDGRQPFFYFISTSENHGPHPCRHYKALTELPVQFTGPATFEQQCGLNEYLRRARSTAEALELVIRELTRIEASTGRPFVLLAYGDHQPWSFTDGFYSVAGGEVSDPAMAPFSALRANQDGYLTFYHLVTSAAGVVKRPFDVPPPATLMPTLISSFVAESEDDLYLPINFLGFVRCGSDFRQPPCALSTVLSRWWKHSLFQLPAPTALEPPRAP